MSKNKLIELCLQNDRRSQKELVCQYAPALLTVSRRYIVDYHYAEDNLQESFVLIFTHLDQFDPNKASIYTWMRTIVIRNALKRNTKESRRLNGSTIVLEEEGDQLTSDDFSLQHLDSEYLVQLIQHLEEPYRNIFNLQAIDGYTHEEISSLLGIEVSTSRSYLFRARKQLMQQLSAEQMNVYGK